jgi:glycosyltransferase involved in cell wall biosynthesis
VEVYLQGVARALSPDHQVLVFSRGLLKDRQHLEVTEARETSAQVTRVHVNLRALKDFREVYQRDEVDRIFRDYLREKKPDLVHIHHLGGLSLGLIPTARTLGLPVVSTLHDHAPLCPRGQRIRDDKRICRSLQLEECLECLKPQCVGQGLPGKAAMYLLAKERGKRYLQEMHECIHGAFDQVARFISPSRSHRDRMVEVGIPAEKIRVLPYGLDLDALESVPARPAGAPVRRFGYLGTLIPSKGVEDVIKAFKRLQTPGCSLHIHGESVPYHGLRDYDRRLAEMARAAEIAFYGPYQPEELGRVLAELDALIMPSRWYESYGITIREAFRAGRPVIVSDIGAFAEAIEHLKNGLRFSAGDVFALAECMDLLAGDPALAERLARTGGPVESLADHRKKLLALYQEVLSEAG